MSARMLSVRAKVVLYTDEKVFGPGVARLMELIREHGSMAEACRLMQMSYSKGWKIIRRAEADLSLTLVSGSRGGKGGGRMMLTDEGEDLLARYNALSRDIDKAAEELFERYFPE